MKCESCNNTVATGYKFCSRECYYKSRIGKSIHSNEERGLRSTRAKQQHSSRSIEEKVSIRHKISEGNKFKYTDEHISKLNELLDLKLTSSDSILAFKLGISKRVLYRIIKENTLTEKFKARPKFIVKKIQSLSTDEQLIFLKDIKKIPWDVMCTKYGISKKNLLLICKALEINHIHKKPIRKETVPEKMVRLILDELGIEFKQEKYLKSKLFRADFLVGANKVIEVNGDYYHANPEVYSHKILTPLQVKNLKSDKLKMDFYKENGFEVLIVWERDLKFNLEKEKEKIKDFIYGK